MQITMEGKYQTRGGLLPAAPVRLLCLDGPRNVYPVVGIVDRKGEREIAEWTEDGLWLRGGPEGEHDLVPVPEPPPITHKMWAVMKSNDTIIYSSYSKIVAEIFCNIFDNETIRLIQWNT